jgi:hypothetical protein
MRNWKTRPGASWRDGSRNRWDAKASTLYLSKIFDWYAKDFDLTFRGGRSRAQFVARYAAELGPLCR